MKRLCSVLKDDGGQGIVEYALILFLVSIVAVGVLQTLGNNVSNTLNALNLGDSGSCDAVNNEGNNPPGLAKRLCK